MKVLLTIGLFVLVSFFSFAEDQAGRTSQSKDGLTSITSEVTKLHSNGKHRTQVHYTAETTRSISLDAVREAMITPDSFSSIWKNVQTSKVLQSPKNDQWVSYFNFDAPWPIKDSDVVQKYQVVSSTETELVIKANSLHDEFQGKTENSMHNFDAVFRFQRISESETHLVLDATFSPAGFVPSWMIKTWLSESPADIVNRIFTLANTKSYSPG